MTFWFSLGRTRSRTTICSSYHVGRILGNTGQCNPTSFTVGNLIQYLRALEAQGLSKEEIIDKYVFFTAGSCGTLPVRDVRIGKSHGARKRGLRRFSRPLVFPSRNAMPSKTVAAKNCVSLLSA